MRGRQWVPGRPLGEAEWGLFIFFLWLLRYISFVLFFLLFFFFFSSSSLWITIKYKLIRIKSPPFSRSFLSASCRFLYINVRWLFILKPNYFLVILVFLNLKNHPKKEWNGFFLKSFFSSCIHYLSCHLKISLRAFLEQDIQLTFWFWQHLNILFFVFFFLLSQALQSSVWQNEYRAIREDFLVDSHSSFFCQSRPVWTSTLFFHIRPVSFSCTAKDYNF